LKPVVIFVTTASEAEATKLAELLLEQRLIACANILSGIHSIFHWENKICKETEFLLILKTTKSKIEQIISQVQSHHSYDVPEIIALPIIEGAQNYLNWIYSETSELHITD